MDAEDVQVCNVCEVELVLEFGPRPVDSSVCASLRPLPPRASLFNPHFMSLFISLFPSPFTSPLTSFFMSYDTLLLRAVEVVIAAEVLVTVSVVTLSLPEPEPEPECFC